MGAACDEASVLHHMNGAGVADGGETVGDDDGGATLHEMIEGLLDLRFGLAVECGGGLVEQEDGGVLEEGAGDRDPLALAAGEAAAILADLGFVTLGLLKDEIMGVGGAGGGLDFLLGRIRAGEKDVVAECIREQEGILTDE